MAAYTDTGTVGSVTSPSSVEAYYVDAATPPCATTPSVAEISAFVDSATVESTTLTFTLIEISFTAKDYDNNDWAVTITRDESYAVAGTAGQYDTETGELV